jgi:hypothetical protein
MDLVKSQHGTKAQLAEKLVGLLDRHEGESDDELRTRIGRASNKQLLRLWAAEQKVKEAHGSKDKLVDAIVSLKFPGPKGNADFRAKLASYTKTHLLDLHGSLVRQAKNNA